MDNVLLIYRYAIAADGTPLVETSRFIEAFEGTALYEDPRTVTLPGYEGRWFLYSLANSFVEYSLEYLSGPPKAGDEYWKGGLASSPTREELTLVGKDEYDAYVKNYEAAVQKAKLEAVTKLGEKKAAVRNRLKSLGFSDEEINVLVTQEW